MVIYLCKESGFASGCCLLCLDIFSVRVRVSTVERSLWSASRALDSMLNVLDSGYA